MNYLNNNNSFLGIYNKNTWINLIPSKIAFASTPLRKNKGGRTGSIQSIQKIKDQKCLFLYFREEKICSTMYGYKNYKLTSQSSLWMKKRG